MLGSINARRDAPMRASPATPSRLDHLPGRQKLAGQWIFSIRVIDYATNTCGPALTLGADRCSRFVQSCVPGRRFVSSFWERSVTIRTVPWTYCCGNWYCFQRNNMVKRLSGATVTAGHIRGAAQQRDTAFACRTFRAAFMAAARIPRLVARAFRALPLT